MPLLCQDGKLRLWTGHSGKEQGVNTMRFLWIRAIKTTGRKKDRLALNGTQEKEKDANWWKKLECPAPTALICYLSTIHFTPV